MKSFTSKVTIVFDINNHEANSKEEYIQKLKDQYEECYGIYLHDHEITMIEEEEPINVYQGA
tara:strand:+ start:443 stop:628 length:186 start_codon:yes stop_codon:yes gene_type:complete